MLATPVAMMHQLSINAISDIMRWSQQQAVVKPDYAALFAHIRQLAAEHELDGLRAMLMPSYR